MTGILPTTMWEYAKVCPHYNTDRRRFDVWVNDRVDEVLSSMPGDDIHVRLLEYMGKDSWELVSVIVVDAQATDWAFFFKRAPSRRP